MTLSKYASLTLALLALGACTVPEMGATAALVYVTKPDTVPADTAHQIPEHESWCYSTMGEPQCFAHPQNVPPERLINVDPPTKYPVDLAAYQEALDRNTTANAAPMPVMDEQMPVLPPPVPSLPPIVSVKPLAPVVQEAPKKAHHKKKKSAKKKQIKAQQPPQPELDVRPTP